MLLIDFHKIQFSIINAYDEQIKKWTWSCKHKINKSCNQFHLSSSIIHIWFDACPSEVLDQKRHKVHKNQAISPPPSPFSSMDPYPIRNKVRQNPYLYLWDVWICRGKLDYITWIRRIRCLKKGMDIWKEIHKYYTS